MSRDRSKGRRSSKSSYRDRDDDDYYRSRRRSLDGRGRFSGDSTGDDHRRSLDNRRASGYLYAEDPSKTDRAAYRTSAAAHTVTKSAGHGVEHLASRGHVSFPKIYDCFWFKTLTYKNVQCKREAFSFNASILTLSDIYREL